MLFVGVIAGVVEFKGVVSIACLRAPCMELTAAAVPLDVHKFQIQIMIATKLGLLVPTYPPTPLYQESLMHCFYICFQKAVSSAAATTPFPHRFVLCLWRLPNTKSRICHCY
jgi:hypothetical protein